MIYKAKDIGIMPDSDITQKLNEFLSKLKNSDDSTEIVFDKANYRLNSEYAVRMKLFITNTIGKNEWRRGEERHANKIGILLDCIDNLTLDFGGSTITVDGKITNIAILNCKNITIKNVRIRTVNPDMHELTVLERGNNYVDYRIDRESRYEMCKNRAFFTGKDYRSDFYDSRNTAYWITKIPNASIDTAGRVRHPLFGARKLKEIEPHVVRAYYLNVPKYDSGDVFYIFENRRIYQGIFIARSKNIILDNIEQTFNYGLAIVAQESENIDVTNSKFHPDSESQRLMTSVADFIQVCMCRGKVNVRNNVFEGAGDDALNVHGIHFKVKSIKGNKIRVKFSHRQTLGFCPFVKGDIIRFINPSALIENFNRFTVADAKLINDYVIEITAVSPIKGKVGAVIENISACPDLLYENNSIKRIVSRGILITTSGKVTVRNNNFIDTSMHSILISDDARTWYESGNVSDVTIANNIFKRCIGYSVQIKPENIVYKGAVHKNIRIYDNVIDSNGEGGFYVKASDEVFIADNEIIGETRQTYIKNSTVEFNKEA